MRPGFSQPYLWLRRPRAKIKPLTIGNITKSTSFEAILHEIGHIWPNLVICFEENGGMKSKWPKFAENIPLVTEPQSRLYPRQRKSSQKWPLATEIGLKRDTPSKVGPVVPFGHLDLAQGMACWIPQLSKTKICLKIIHLKCYRNLPWASVLTISRLVTHTKG